MASRSDIGLDCESVGGMTYFVEYLLLICNLVIGIGNLALTTANMTTVKGRRIMFALTIMVCIAFVSFAAFAYAEFSSHALWGQHDPRPVWEALVGNNGFLPVMTLNFVAQSHRLLKKRRVKRTHQG